MKAESKSLSERILVVDDTPTNIDLLEGILTSEGYTLDSAESDEEALDNVVNDTQDMYPAYDSSEAVLWSQNTAKKS